MAANVLRNIPSVGELLDSPPLKKLVDRLNHNVVVAGARTILDDVRSELQSAAAEKTLPSVVELAERIAGHVLRQEEPSLRVVINATGILLHTGLGRAPLSDDAIAAMDAVARDYASVELDLETGRRSQRVLAVEGLITELTGAAAATVVNNNAGATMLTLAAIAAGQEVVVSRGELIEIGGSFRLPAVMETSGCILREVGTTNKTHLDDYRQAIGDQTAALMQVHTSNYVVVGFTSQPTLRELAALAHEHRLPLIHDIGSGALVDFGQFGCRSEPVVSQSIVAGADLVLFSGDKLLGGPQCGIIAGRRDLVEQIARHPMMRALRVDKLTLAALSATLLHYRHPDEARREIPLLQMASASAENLKQRAQRLAPQIAESAVIAEAEAVEGVTYLGGGSLPAAEVATWCVALTPDKDSVDQLAARLRVGSPSIVGRVQDNRLLLDLRSVFPRHDMALVECIVALGSDVTS